MIDLSFLAREIWYTKPNLKNEDFKILKSKDKYGGFIYVYTETDLRFSKRIKRVLMKNKNEKHNNN